MEQNVTFNGQEAVPLNVETMELAIKLLEKASPPQIAMISHNCEPMDFKEAIIDRDSVRSDIIPAFYGLPVYITFWIPKNEIWLQDKDGSVIKKFRI